MGKRKEVGGRRGEGGAQRPSSAPRAFDPGRGAGSVPALRSSPLPSPLPLSFSHLSLFLHHLSLFFFFKLFILPPLPPRPPLLAMHDGTASPRGASRHPSRSRAARGPGKGGGLLLKATLPVPSWHPEGFGQAGWTPWSRGRELRRPPWASALCPGLVPRMRCRRGAGPAAWPATGTAASPPASRPLFCLRRPDRARPRGVGLLRAPRPARAASPSPPVPRAGGWERGRTPTPPGSLSAGWLGAGDTRLAGMARPWGVSAPSVAPGPSGQGMLRPGGEGAGGWVLGWEGRGGLAGSASAGAVGFAFTQQPN